MFAWRCKACKGPPIAGNAREKPWIGPCPHCGRSRDADRVSVAEDDDVKGALIQPIKEGEVISLADAIAQAEIDPTLQAIATGSPGLDWVLGGGIPIGIGLLLSSPPGAGKTTMLVEVLRSLAKRRIKVLHISTEESTRQLGRRFSRLQGAMPPRLQILCTQDIDEIEQAILGERPKIAAVDSIHKISGVSDDNGFAYSTGSHAAMTLAANRLRKIASDLDMSIFCVAHVDKSGNISGANTVQHDLDLTLYLNGKQETRDGRSVIVGPERTLRCDGKNRYAEAGRCAHFQMLGDGFHDRGPWVSDVPPWFEEEKKEGANAS